MQRPHLLALTGNASLLEVPLKVFCKALDSWVLVNFDFFAPSYRPISSQTCCTVATAPGAAVVGRKQLSSADEMAFWLTSTVHRERFLLIGVFVQRFQAPSGQAFCLAVLAMGKVFCSSLWTGPGRFFTDFGDRRVDMKDMTYGSPATATVPLLPSTVMS